MGRPRATWDPDTFLMWSSQILKLRILHIKKYLETSVFLEKLEFFRTGVAIISYSPVGAPPLYWFALSRSHNPHPLCHMCSPSGMLHSFISPVRSMHTLEMKIQDIFKGKELKTKKGFPIH